VGVSRPVLCAIFLSGSAGLLYELTWVRLIGNLFGNTVEGAALVVAVFMLGLGLGGYGAGRWADRRGRDGQSLLHLYASFELGIAVLGAAASLLLPLLEPLSAAVSSYEFDSNGWATLSTGSYLARLGLCGVVLLPSVVLMGGTLTVLIRHVVAADLGDSGRRVGWLYGINTAGAALGCFAIDFALVPSLGVTATVLIAPAFNLVAALIAMHAAKAATTSESDLAPDADRSHVEHRRDSVNSSGVLSTAAIAIFLSGLAAAGLHIFWFRFLGSVLGDLRSTFSLLLGVILVGIWLGSVGAGALEARWRRPALLFLVSQTLFIASCLLAFVAFDPALKSTYGLTSSGLSDDPTGRFVLDVWYRLRSILLLVAVPALATGATYPLANALVQRSREEVGQRAGVLYLANTLGAVIGSLGAGFVLLPRAGIQVGVLILLLCATGSIATVCSEVWRSERSGKSRWAAPLALIIASIALLGWNRLPTDYLSLKSFTEAERSAGFLSLSEGVTQSVAVAEVPGSDARLLYTNGALMSATVLRVQRYMRLFAHLPLLQMQSPRTVLVICFGVGNTVHAASLHPSVERIEIADLSREVFEQAHHFRKWNRDVLDAPRVHVFLNDGRQHLRMRPPETFDLVTLEPPPLAFAGVSALYSREFYELVRSRLRNGGFVTQWLPAYQVEEDVARAMVRAFVEVFPDGIVLSGYRRHLILMGRKNASIEIDPDAVAAKISNSPAVAADHSDDVLAPSHPRDHQQPARAAGSPRRELRLERRHSPADSTTRLPPRRQPGAAGPR